MNKKYLSPFCYLMGSKHTDAHMNTHNNNNQLLQSHNLQRTKCLVYTRVMGYHRPVESFNIGKKGEHKQRTHFTEGKCC